MTTLATIKQALHTYIVHSILKNKGLPVADDMRLLSDGLIDSINIVEIILFLENRFAIDIPESDITFENVDTIERIAMLTQRHIARQHESPESNVYR